MSNHILDYLYENFTIDKPDKPALAGLLFQEGKVIGTDAHILAAVNTDYPAENEGKVLDEFGLEIESDYPNYKAIIPTPNTIHFKCLPEDNFKEVSKAVYKLINYANDDNRVLLDLDLATFDVELLRIVIGVFEIIEEQPKLYLRKSNLPSMLQSENCTCLIMPPLADGFCYENDTCYKLEDALKETQIPINFTEPTQEKKEQPTLQEPVEEPEDTTLYNELSIDIETYSPEDLASTGVYKYAAHPEFEILLFAYAFDDEPVTVIDLTREALPEKVIAALTNPAIKKTAFNANFERVCIKEHFKIDIPVEQWECTMVKAAKSGLPLSLEQCAQVLKVDNQKMAEGKALIRLFSCPKKTKTGYKKVSPKEFPEKWQKFIEYCKQDVATERSIKKALKDFSDFDESECYQLDQNINDRGVLIDIELAKNALQMDASYKEVLTAEASNLTDLNNPNSVAQLKAWISEETGEDIESLTKDSLKDLLKTIPSEEVTRVLKIRQEMAKTSVMKYKAMLDAVCQDGRVRGLHQYYGANRSGRWAGRIVQPQNLPQNHLIDLDLARQMVKENDQEMLEMLFGNVPDTLSQLIRTAFIPKEGHTFIVADFSAIEARVIAWLAGEKWRMEVFATHGKIYEASASQMFHVPIESVTKGSDLRQKGKVSELALGYQGGVNALKAMGALKMGVKEEELQGLVDAWRAANPAICVLWDDVNKAAIKAVKNHTREELQKGITFFMFGNDLHIKLPSGRHLVYVNAAIAENRFGSKGIQYEGMNQKTKKWETLETYGGKLVENIVQAIARDCLAIAMKYLDAIGYKIVMHVHDEVVIEVPVTTLLDKELELVCNKMGSPVPWAPGLLLRADGYITDYYKKD